MGLGECFQSAFTPSLDRKFSIYTCIAKRLHEKYRTFLQNKKTVQAQVNMMVGTPPTPPPRLRGELRYAPHHHRRGRRRNQAHRPQHRAQFLACGLLRGVLRGEHRREHGRRAADPRSDQRIAQQQPSLELREGDLVHIECAQAQPREGESAHSLGRMVFCVW